MMSREIWFTGSRNLEIRERPLAEPMANERLVRTALCGISAGTEGLLWRNEFPPQLLLDESIPELQRSCRYPYPYGYTLVGHEADSGEPVLIFHPHADQAVVAEDRLIRLPGHWEPERGVFLPNTETALNLVLDAAPRAGEQVVVMGLGIVGLLTTAILSEYPLAELIAVDPIPERRERASRYARTLAPDQLSDALGTGGADLVLEVSGAPKALQTALDIAGFAGRVIVGSWYGSKDVTLNLGRDFHRKRLSIRSSQVSTIAPELRGRWDHSRRLDAAVAWLDRCWEPTWITHRISFDRAEDAYRLIETPGSSWLQIVLVP